MNRLDRAVLAVKCRAGRCIRDFFEEERGDVNIVSMVVLIGVAVLMAMLFKNQIKSLLESLLGTITSNATKAVES